jgi:hypothetical protein
MRRLSSKIFIVSTVLAIAVLIARGIHGYLTGATLHTYQDPTPEIQRRMAVHVPISDALFCVGTLVSFLSVGSGGAVVVQKLKRKSDG